jgi:hypothetical protein
VDTSSPLSTLTVFWVFSENAETSRFLKNHTTQKNLEEKEKEGERKKRWQTKVF